MAPLLEDPRYRQTWNQISQNAESATEQAAAGIWNFQHNYINPCFASIGKGFEQCTGHCFPDREERARRQRERGRTRGRAELSFDFYDDWDEDDGVGSRGLLGGWGNDELDRLLAGSGSHSGTNEAVNQAPKRKRGMSYGTRGRRKSLDPDPTVIPSTSALGFLGRLPFKFGGTLRYKPSAADLQENPGGMRHDTIHNEEGEPLITDEDSEDELHIGKKGHARKRSSTASSGATSGSFRSRGDLYPSDGEDDAVPLDDEFAMALERRMTGTAGDDRSSGKTRSSKGKRPASSRNMSRNLSRATQASQSRPSINTMRSNSEGSLQHSSNIGSPDLVETPSLMELQYEEERIRLEEDGEVERKREAAARLARARGLSISHASEETIVEAKQESSSTVEDIPPPSEEPAAPPTTTTEESVESRDSRESTGVSANPKKEFVPARLPFFN